MLSRRRWWLVVVILLFGSLLAVIYIWRVVEVAYFQTPDDEATSKVQEAPLQLLIPLWTLVIANIYLKLLKVLIIKQNDKE